MYQYMHFTDLHYIHTCIHLNNLLMHTFRGKIPQIFRYLFNQASVYVFTQNIMHSYMHSSKEQNQLSCIFIQKKDQISYMHSCILTDKNFHKNISNSLSLKNNFEQ